MESEEYPMPGRLSWFSADELCQSQKQIISAFIEAWHQHYPSLEEFRQSLNHHHESYQDVPKIVEKIDFPTRTFHCFFSGRNRT